MSNGSKARRAGLSGEPPGPGTIEDPPAWSRRFGHHHDARYRCVFGVSNGFPDPVVLSRLLVDLTHLVVVSAPSGAQAPYRWSVAVRATSTLADQAVGRCVQLAVGAAAGNDWRPDALLEEIDLWDADPIVVTFETVSVWLRRPAPPWTVPQPGYDAAVSPMLGQGAAGPLGEALRPSP